MWPEAYVFAGIMDHLNPMLDALDRRPDAGTFKIEDLLAEVRRGRIRIPNFQRTLKWGRDDVAKLIDSLYRGFPVGTLLFWETKAEPQEMKFGSVTVSGGRQSNALWVVDGQQRIVSLSRVLLATEPDGDAFALYFDLDDLRFVAPPSPTQRAGDPARWLPMNVVLDSEKLMQWVFEKAAKDETRRARAFLVGKRIREYEIPAYIVRSENENVLREIFERINSSGKPLKADEVFDALHGGRSTQRPATIREIVTELESFGFGRIEEKILYRLLRVLHGADVTDSHGDGPFRLADDEAEQAYRLTAEVAARVIQFLKHDVGIPHYELLPYKQPIVTLGKFFHHYPTPGSRSRDLLVRWVWRGALNGAHRGDTVSTRRSLDQIVPGDEDASVQRMLDMVRSSAAECPDAAGQFNFRFAASKLQALALIELGPRDLQTGALLELGPLFNTPNEEWPVPSVLASRRLRLVQSVANRLIHPSRTGLRKILVEAPDSAVLTSHGITESAHAALQAGNAERFLELRLEYLEPCFVSFFERRARWNELDRPSLSALLISDEEDA